jgi:hypothetical protein
MADPLPGPRLMVPTDLSALVVTSGASDPRHKWADVTPDYSVIDHLDTFLGALMLPNPLKEQPTAPDPGVHLHWALPDALTHGVQTDSGMSYPLVPNRWLVTRSWWDASANKTQSKAWVVQSDALSADDPAAGAQCVTWPVRSGGSYDQQWLGAVMDSASWTGDTGSSPEPFLTAVGPGDPTFAACYWNCRGVFALRDPAADLQVPSGTTVPLTYSVVGWYSDPAKGPLAGCSPADDWTKRMAELKWIVPPGATAMPTDVLVHGLLHSVQWGGASAAYQSGVPVGSVDVSFGNTSAEALSALLRDKLSADKDVEDVLEAFQYGVLGDYEGPDGALALDHALHEREFGSTQGGSTWDVRRKAGLPPGTDVAAQLPDPVAAALATLNGTQVQVDAAQRALESARRKLYSIWFRKAELDISPLGPQPPFDQLPDWIQENLWPLVDDRQKALASLETQLSTDRAAVQALLVGPLADYELALLAAPRFWQPNNPVVLLSGDGVERTFRHGADDHFGDLLCRVPGQAVTALTVNGQLVDATRLGAFTAPAPTIGGSVPAELPALALEAALLAPSLAVAIAWAGLAASGVSNPTPKQVADWATAAQAVQNGAWDALGELFEARALAAGAGITGTVPSKVAVSLWTQPWVPLSFQWSASWFPSSLDRSNQLTGWKLDDGADYTWSGGKPAANPAVGVPGAAPMNQAAAIGLATAIDKYLADHPNDPNAQTLRDVAAKTANLNAVAQALSGFNGTLCGTIETLQFPVIDPYSPTLGAGVAQRAADANGVSPNPASPAADSGAQTFFPIRAGHVLFGELRVVDAFGQSQEVIAPNVDPDLICSTPLTTAGAPTLAQLAPRIAQPSRLSFRFVAADPPHGVANRAADSGLVDANRAPAASPVAAWLLPNRLDASLMVYDPSGAPRGELQLIEGSLDPSGRGVRWVQAPGEPVTYGAGPDLPPHAQEFAEEMIALSTGGESALVQLMAAIDEGLWTVDPLGSWSDQALAQLVGRPLALVRASLAIELNGDPAFDITWRGVKNLLAGQPFDDFGLTATPFDVTIGNSKLLTDGLIGYFYDDDYSRFYLAQYGKAPAAGGYVVPAQPIPLKPGAAPTTVTMIVDPRAAIHATSGIQPTKSIQLPPDQVQAALAAIVITFMTGPLVTDAKVLAAPMPGGGGRGWSWLEHPTPAEWQIVPQIATPKATAELAATTQRLVDGWIKRADAFGPNGTRRSMRGR